MKKQFLFTRLIAFVAIIVSLLVVLYTSGLSVSDLSPQLIVAIADNHTALVILLMLLLMLLQNLFTFIPLILVITINITLFGFWPGYILSTISSVIGSTAIFLCVRYFFGNLFSLDKFKKYEQKINKNGFIFVLSGRILPFLPTNLINIVSGLSNMNIMHFAAATTLGNMIYGLVLAAISYGVVSVSQQSKHLFYGIITMVVIIFIWRFMKKQQSNQVQDE